MIAKIEGRIVKVEPREYTTSDGERRFTFDAWLRSLENDDPAYGADRISGPAELTPALGDVVQFECIIDLRTSKAGKQWLRVWALRSRTAQNV